MRLLGAPRRHSPTRGVFQRRMSVIAQRAAFWRNAPRYGTTRAVLEQRAAFWSTARRSGVPRAVLEYRAPFWSTARRSGVPRAVLEQRATLWSNARRYGVTRRVIATSRAESKSHGPSGQTPEGPLRSILAGCREYLSSFHFQDRSRSRRGLTRRGARCRRVDDRAGQFEFLPDMRGERRRIRDEPIRLSRLLRCGGGRTRCALRGGFTRRRGRRVSEHVLRAGRIGRARSGRGARRPGRARRACRTGRCRCSVGGCRRGLQTAGHGDAFIR